MKRLVVFAFLVSVCMCAFGADSFPNSSEKGIYTVPFHIGIIEQFVPADVSVNRVVRIPSRVSERFHVGSYTGIRLDSLISTGNYKVTANFVKRYDYGTNGSYIQKSVAFPSNNAAIPIPPECAFVYFNVGSFTAIEGSTVNVTVDMKIGNGVGSTLNIVSLSANTPTLINLGDHGSVAITKGSADVWLGGSNSVTVNNGKILDTTYPTHTYVGSYSLYGLSATATTLSVAEDY